MASSAFSAYRCSANVDNIYASSSRPAPPSVTNTITAYAPFTLSTRLPPSAYAPFCTTNL